MATGRAPRRWLRWTIGAVIVVVVLAVGGPFIFLHFIEGSAPAPLSLNASASPAASSTSAAGGSTGPLAGSWKTTSGSQVGYRVQEILAGQSHTAVGRSSSVTGQLVIAGTTLKTAAFTVPIATIHSDSSQRDAQFDGRIMDVTAFPSGAFTLTRAIVLAPLPAAGTIRTYTATGNLTLHGQARPVTFPLRAERSAAGISVSGSIPVLFSRWDIPNPSFTGFVTTQNHGILEFLLDFQRA